MPAVPRGQAQESPTYLPSSCNYKDMHSEYVKPSGDLGVMGYRAFGRLWMSKCKTIKFVKTFWYNKLSTLRLHDNVPRRSLNDQDYCRWRWCKSKTPPRNQGAQHDVASAGIQELFSEAGLSDDHRAYLLQKVARHFCPQNKARFVAALGGEEP